MGAETPTPHEVSRDAATRALDRAMNRTLSEIDETGVLDRPGFNKGAPDAVVEQSVFGYPADCARRPDLSVDGVPTELKTTGLIKKTPRGGTQVLDAKEPVSITAVQPETIVEEEFETSAFLEICGVAHRSRISHDEQPHLEPEEGNHLGRNRPRRPARWGRRSQRCLHEV